MQPVGRGPALSDLLQMLTAIFNGSMNRQFANQSLGASTVPDMKTVWVMTRAARVMAAVGASIPGAVTLACELGPWLHEPQARVRLHAQPQLASDYSSRTRQTACVMRLMGTEDGLKPRHPSI